MRRGGAAELDRKARASCLLLLSLVSFRHHPGAHWSFPTTWDTKVPRLVPCSRASLEEQNPQEEQL